ncbi:MAG: hypothetical protein M3O33_20175 [Cyanobacteriota bacterium]|nr:hypothetical protein [Cyanobacteriota bacterium]
MTDHLEPYRRMARSIRFFPPFSLTPPVAQSVDQPVKPASEGDSWTKKTLADAQIKTTVESPIDPSEHAAALVHEAVWKSTVLPATYRIPENIGDRISRLTAAKPVEPMIIQPKIPQPAPNGTAASLEPAIASPIDPERAAALVHEAVWKSTVLPESYTIPENIGDRISRLTDPKPVEPVIQPASPQPDSPETDAQTIEPEPQAIEADTKKPLDDTSLEAVAPATVAAVAPTVEETSSDDPVAVVVEPVVIEEIPNDQAAATGIAEAELVETAETSDDEAAATVVAEPVEAQETASDEAATVVAEPVEVPATPSDEAATIVAEPVEAQETPSDEAATIVAEPVEAQETASDEAATIVAEPVEAQDTLSDEVATVVAEPVEAQDTPSNTSDNNTPADVVTESDAVIEAASDSVSDTDAPVTEADDAQAPTFLEKVSSLIEAASTAFQNPDSVRNDSEAVVEPAPLEPPTTETAVADTDESLTTDASVDEAEQAQAPSLLDRVSAVVEAVATTLKDSDTEKKNPEATVESAPVAEEKASDTQTLEVTCPSCGSTDLRKNGRRQAKQRYACKECGRQFAMLDSAEAEDKPKHEARSSVETSQVKNPQDVSDSGSKPAKGGSKKKTKAKGFGASKKAK